MPNKRQHDNIISNIEQKENIIDKSVKTLEEAQAQYDRLQISAKRLSNIDETLKKVRKNITLPSIGNWYTFREDSKQ